MNPKITTIGYDRKPCASSSSCSWAVGKQQFGALPPPTGMEGGPDKVFTIKNKYHLNLINLSTILK